MTRKTDIIHLSDFPAPPDHGFSVYKGVIIVWDRDRDERILDFIDALPEDVREELAIASESKGALALVWKNYIILKQGKSVEVKGDSWIIWQSKLLGE
jgi:hypothetical protein